MSLIKGLINNDFFRLRESARLCRQCIEPAFSFDVKKWNSADEYVVQFCNTNLHDVWTETKGGVITRLQRIEHLQDEMKNTIDHLMVYRDYLSLEQVKVLTQILSSKLFTNPIEPIVWVIPERDRIHKQDNQKDIDKNIYDIYNLLRILNH